MTAAILCAAILATWPDVPRDRACAASDAIVAVATDEYPAELLAAIAYGESKFQLGLTGARGEVGPWQVKLYGANKAARRRAALTTYGAGVAEAIRRLDESAAYCARRRTPGMLCTLAGYRSGPAGVRGRWYSGPRMVLRRASLLRMAAGHAPGKAVGS